MRLPITSSLILCCGLLLSGCQTLPTLDTSPEQEPQALAHSYDFRLYQAPNQPITVLELAQQLKEIDVVFIGEFHGNHASHLLQMQLQAALFQLRPEQVLSMEMFERHQQPVLNRYLDGEVGEKYLINEAPAWPNYAGSYRPMIEFAKHNFLPVIAANAPGDIVRCIGQYGQSYLDVLPTDEKAKIAKNSFLNDEAYQTKFYEFMEEMRHGKMNDERKANSYAAQLTRDNTMAESILQALDDHPQAQVIHLNGSFHSAEHLGTVALLKQRRPDLKVAVITPIRVNNPEAPKLTQDDLNKGDYLYLIQPQPEEYLDASYRRQAMQNMFANSKDKAKRCLAIPATHPSAD